MDKIKVVVPLHGIRTIASWQRTLSDAVQNVGWKCALDKWNYGIFSLFRFLIPRQRESRVSWFRSTYTEFINDRTFEIDDSNLPSIVAHSFGTYILGYSLLKYNNIRFDKVILCGSILPEDFPWRDILARGQVNAVRNEFGTNDFWSNIVRWFVEGTGASGKKGFWYQHPRLFQQAFLFQHSEYFERGHMDEYWIPFIRKEIAVEGVARELPVHRPRPNIPWGLYGLYLIIAATASIYVIPWGQLTGVAQIAALQSQLATATTQNTTLQSKLETAQRQRDAAQQKLAAAEGQLATPHPDVAKISELESQLSVARREVQSAKQAEEAARNMPPRVDPIYTLNAFSAAEGLFQELLSSNTSILATSTRENDYAKFDLNNTLSVGERKLPPGKSLMLYEPNNTSDLDVPHPASYHNGIVIHGSGLSNNVLIGLKNVLRERCFIEPHTTAAVPDELKKYYKRDNIIWIEIGSGSPWLNGGSCPD